MAGCKADIYFLADNTGSMGDIVDTVKADGLDMLEALVGLPGVDLRFGVGNYQDFPTAPTAILYGNRFHRPNAITVAAGSIERMVWATGPIFQGTTTWPGAVTATYSSPVDHVTIPLDGGYITGLRILAEFSGSSMDSVQVRAVSNLQGLIAGATDDLLVSPVDISSSASLPHFSTGEEIYVEVQNNGPFPIEIRWDSQFWMRKVPPVGFIGFSPYDFMHQLDPTTDQETIAAAFQNWRADLGADYPEGWLYALDQLAEAGFWRPNAMKFIIDIGDAPPHDPVCAAISGLDYDITEESVTDKLVEGGFVYIGVSHSDPGGGLNDEDTSSSNNYDPYCGHNIVESGHADRIALATNGFVQYFSEDTDVVSAILDVVVAALGECHNARRRLPWVGHIS